MKRRESQCASTPWFDRASNAVWLSGHNLQQHQFGLGWIEKTVHKGQNLITETGSIHWNHNSTNGHKNSSTAGTIRPPPLVESGSPDTHRCRVSDVAPVYHLIRFSPRINVHFFTIETCCVLRKICPLQLRGEYPPGADSANLFCTHIPYPFTRPRHSFCMLERLAQRRRITRRMMRATAGWE